MGLALAACEQSVPHFHSLSASSPRTSFKSFTASVFDATKKSVVSMAKETVASSKAATLLPDTYQYKDQEVTRPDQLRVLKLKPSGVLQDPIEGLLETSLRKDVGAYTALSYWWGNPNQAQEQMKINGETLSIGVELATALRHLRWPKEECIL